MSVGTAAAIAIGVSAGTSIYAANKSAGAAKTAAGMQQQSVGRAQDFAQQAYQQQQQALLPYREAGQNALNQLMARQYGPGGTAGMNAGQVGLQNAPGWQGGGFSLASLRPGGGGMPGGPQGQMPFNQPPPGGPPQGQPPLQGVGPWQQGGMPPGQMQQPMGQPQGAPGMGGPMQGPPPQGPQIPQGGMVTVTDDTGASRQVPAAQAPLYAQKGFTVKAM